MSMIHRRRAIFTALNKYFSGDDRLKILSYWEQYFSDKPSFALHQFISGFVDLCNPPVSRSEIFKEMTYQLMQPEKKLLNDPVVELEQYRYNNKVKAQNDRMERATTKVFEGLLNQVFDALRADRELTIRNYIVFQIQQMSLDVSMSSSLIDWLNRDVYELSMSDVNVSTLRKVIQIVYVGLIEHSGAEEAESLMDNATAVAKDLPEANIFSPYQFF